LAFVVALALSLGAGAGVAVTAAPAAAHFQELIPSADIVSGESSAKDRTIRLGLTFTHPMERGPVMDMGRPVAFGVLAADTRTDLLPALTEKRITGKVAYEAAYPIKTPGDYVFYLEPARYWEPAERAYIIHYTKVVVDFGSGEGWDRLAGLPVEIEPLTRPYGLWTHGSFTGLVRRNGAPLPFATLEIEWRNDGSVTAPADPFITQVLKADANGVFAFALPRAGWWGFNALIEAENPPPAPDGGAATLELGGTLWIKATDMR